MLQHKSVKIFWWLQLEHGISLLLVFINLIAYSLLRAGLHGLSLPQSKNESDESLDSYTILFVCSPFFTAASYRLDVKYSWQ